MLAAARAMRGRAGPAVPLLGQPGFDPWCLTDPASRTRWQRRPVTIAGRQLRPMQQFTFDVSAEEMAEGGQFVRRLLPGPFHPTSNIDYCDPTAEH
jgi:hypothetical protein